MGGYFAPPRMHGPERFKIMYTRAQGLFAAANIFSSLKLVYIFSVNPYLGHAGVNPLKFLQWKVVRQPDEVVAPLDYLGLVNPHTGGNTGILLAPL